MQNLNIEVQQAQKLESLFSLATIAHRNTSFDPEKRGRNLVNEFSAKLESDLQLLESKNVSSELLEQYEAGFIKMLKSWLHAKSNCFSVMITGGSNFPVRRHEKANASERNRYNKFAEWTEKTKKWMVKSTVPKSTPETKLEAYKLDYKNRIEQQERMKKINAAYPKFLKVIAENKDRYPFQSINQLTDSEISIMLNHVPDYQTKSKVFPTWALTNNNANIKRLSGIIQKLENQEAAREFAKDSEELKAVYNFEGGKIVVDRDTQRINIYHEEKPEREIIQNIKSHGFRWSPRFQSWTRQLTPNALFSTNQLFPGLSIK